MARPTMRDVASTAGVSLKTVSRVVNSENGVRPATAARVEAAIAQLGFARNDVARSLRHGRANALGLVIEDVANPFYSAIARTVEDVAHARSHILITGSCEEDAERERELVLRLLRRSVDALLIVPAGDDHRYLQPELDDGTPIVFLDRPPRGVEADTVLLDNVGGARAAVAHLLAHGHERIAYVGDPPPLYTAAERLAGYRAALRDAGLPADEELVSAGPHDAASAERAVRDLLALPADRRPTALFTANNRNTVGALRALRDGDGTVALVGFDDFELADMLPVPVTVVRHDPAEMGRIAAEMAYLRLDGDDRAPQRRTIDVHRRGPRIRGAARAMTPTAIKLPPNPIRHFYRGGPAIAELRGIDVGGDHSPEEWIGSATTLFGESERGLSRMPDGGLVRDALAADPEGWLGAAHAARFGAEPRAAGQAAGRRRAPARPPPSRPPVRARAPRTGLRQDRGVDRPRGARRRGGGRRLARGRRGGHAARAGSTRRTTTPCSAR